MGLGWFLGKKNKEDKTAEAAGKPVAEPFFVSEKAWSEEESPAISCQEMLDTETVDAKFARYNNMWVCAYCETLNRCLPGDSVTMPSKKAPVAPQPMLRGNLLKKRIAEQANKGLPECIACGKPRTRRV